MPERVNRIDLFSVRVSLIAVPPSPPTSHQALRTLATLVKHLAVATLSLRTSSAGTDTQVTFATLNSFAFVPTS